MSATEPLWHLLGIGQDKLTKEEKLILEIELFTRLCDELKEAFKIRYKNYFEIIKFEKSENEIMEDMYARCVVNDLLSTKEYTLEGIAYYTQTPEEIVYEIAMGKNTNPSAVFLRKIIELHRSSRQDLYSAMIKKVLIEIARF